MPRSRSRCGRDRPDAPQRIDRQRLEEALDALGRDDRQAVGLLPAEAILARNLFGATPADAVRPVAP